MRYFVSKYKSLFTFNRCFGVVRCYVFLFFSVFLDLSGKNAIRSFIMQLTFFNAETDVPLTSPNYRVRVAKFGHTMLQNESIRTYPIFNRMNYR